MSNLPGGRDYLTPLGGAAAAYTAQLFLTPIGSIDSEESSPKYIGVKIHRSMPVLKFEFPIEWKLLWKLVTGYSSPLIRTRL